MKLKPLLAALTLCACLLTMSLPAAAASSSFSDVNDPATAVNADVLRLMGVVSGSGGNRFSPADHLTRAQFSVMAVKVMGRGDEVPLHTTRTIFTDVTARHWARGYINLAASITVGGDGQTGSRLISGVGTGHFDPDAPITFAQSVTILMRMLGYTDTQVGSVWPAGYLNLAASLGLTEGVSAAPHAPITRAQAAELFVNLLSTPTLSGRPYCTTLGAATEDVMLLAVNVTGDDARPGAIRTSQGTFHPAAQGVIPTALPGTRGTLVLNERSQLVAFVPDNSSSITLTLSGSPQAAYVTAADGTRYAISSSTPAFTGAQDGQTTWGKLWVDVPAGARLTLFMDGGKVIGVYYPSGGTSAEEAYVVTGKLNSGSFHQLTGGVDGYTIEKDGQSISLSDIQKYDVITYDGVSNTLLVSDLRLNCVYEAPYPNPETPESLTVLGHTFPVLECALDSIEPFKLGDTVTLLLTADGKIAGMTSPGRENRPTAMGIAGTNGVTVVLPNGQSITLSGSIPKTTVGRLVTVNGGKQDVISAVPMGSPAIHGDFRVADMTLGEYKVAAGVKLYEQVGNSGIVPLNLAELEEDVIEEDQLSLFHCNTSGMVDAIIINAVTGDAYDYGMLHKGSISHSLGNLTAENTTVRVETSSGIGAELITGKDFEDGCFGGMAPGSREIAGTAVAADVVELTAVSGVKRADFFQKDGVWFVNAAGTVYRISSRVEGYRTYTGTWVSSQEDVLQVMRAYSDDLTVHIDPVGHKVRVITAK